MIERSKGAIQNALRSCEVKDGIYLQKLLLEAIARSKIHHAIEADEKFSEQIDKMQILMQSVIENITKQNFDEMVQFKEFIELPQLRGDLANFLEHYIYMVNLL